LEVVEELAALSLSFSLSLSLSLSDRSEGKMLRSLDNVTPAKLFFSSFGAGPRGPWTCKFEEADQADLCLKIRSGGR
jgi:hypothetical protein